MSARCDIATPDFRVALRDRELFLIPWRPGLIGPSGPSNQLLPHSAAALADLTVIREAGERNELIVTPLTAGATARMRKALGLWAAMLDYRRIWFDDGVLELRDCPSEFAATVQTRCAVCRADWRDGAPEFWLSVRTAGAFPLWCPVCGSALPQWSPTTEAPGQAYAACTGARGRQRPAGAGCGSEAAR